MVQLVELALESPSADDIEIQAVIVVEINPRSLPARYTAILPVFLFLHSMIPSGYCHYYICIPDESRIESAYKDTDEIDEENVTA